MLLLVWPSSVHSLGSRDVDSDDVARDDMGSCSDDLGLSGTGSDDTGLDDVGSGDVG